MLPPHELGQKTFTKAMRGYEPAEVDEYIDFLIENYTELYKISDDYDKKLRVIASRIKSIKDDENTIRNAVINAQKMSDATVAEANEKAKEIINEATAAAETITLEAQKKSESILFDTGRKNDKKICDAQAKADVIVSTAQAKSDALLYSAKQRCAKVLADYRLELRSIVELLTQTKHAADQFRTELFDAYKTHIDMIKVMVPNINVDLSTDYETRFTSEILEGIKEDAISASEQIDEKATDQVVPDILNEEVDVSESENAEQQTKFDDTPELTSEDISVYNAEVEAENSDDDVVNYVRTPSYSSVKEENNKMQDKIKLGDMYISSQQELDYSEEYIDEFEDEAVVLESEDDISYDDDIDQQDEDYYLSETKKKKKNGFLGLFSGKNKDKKSTSNKDNEFSDDQSDEDEDEKNLDIFQGFDE